MESFLISGVPGAGKTTVSRALASRLGGSAVAIEGDVLSFDFVVNGLASPDDGERWELQMDLRRRNICMLTESYQEAGFAVVIDDVVVSRRALDAYARLSSTPTIVVLVPNLEVVRRRDADRNKHVFHVWAHLDAELRKELSDVGHWIDSSELSVDETVDQILAIG